MERSLIVQDQDPDQQFDRAARIISALNSTQRLQIILKLEERDHVVHELVTALKKSQPLISQHLRVLKHTGLVTSRRAGREVVYSLAVPEAADIIKLAEHVGAIAAGEPTSLASLSAMRHLELQRDDTAEIDPTIAPHLQSSSETDGKAAIAGYGENESLTMPGLKPSLPHPPSPEIV